MAKYYTLLRTFKADLQNHEKFKKDTIIKLAKALEEERLCLIEQINDKLAQDLEGYITRSYIGICLEKKYKKKGFDRHKKKVEVATDGTEILSEQDKLKEEERKKEEEDSKKFFEDMNKTLDTRAEETKSLNDIVVQELDKIREENKTLQSKLNESITAEEYESMKIDVNLAKNIVDDVKNHLGEYIKFEEDETGEIELIEVLAEKTNTYEVKIDLRKFEDGIKESYKRGKHSALLRISGEKVVDWS